MNKKQLYAIVDVETTGGRPADSKVTELAICISDGERIVDEFSTLVNPCKPIDSYVVKLTKITDEMVSTAPLFADVADKVKEMLSDKLFVAHNADFDYNMIRRELFDINDSFSMPKLCTVKASKKLMPGLSSYSLGNLCQHLEIDLENAHRALDDTRATSELLHKLLETSSIEFLTEEIKNQNYEIVFPEHWKTETIDVQPQTGILTFLDENDAILYIESSKNVQKTLYKLLNNQYSALSNSEKLIAQSTQVAISYFDSLLKADMVAMNDVQHHRPRYNKPLRNYQTNFGLYFKKDDIGMEHLQISSIDDIGEEYTGPIVYSASVKNAEKVKRKLMQKPQLGQMTLLKKNAIKTHKVSKDTAIIDNYNREMRKFLLDNVCCPIREGYYVFEILDENRFEGVYVKNYDIVSWGIGVLENGKVTDFSSEFDFFENQKLNRKFLERIKKESYKIIPVE